MTERGRASFRLAVRVKPGASRTKVGGRHGESSLIVAVTEKAVDGRATEAVLRAVADAIGVPRRSVSLLTGATSRDKILAIAAFDDDHRGDLSSAELAGRVSALLA